MTSNTKGPPVWRDAFRTVGHIKFKLASIRWQAFVFLRLCSRRKHHRIHDVRYRKPTRPDRNGPGVSAVVSLWPTPDDYVFNATLQPASTFMNSVRERLSSTMRAGAGARVAGSYLQGASFNPRVLIALLNIFRVHYNFFESWTYVSLHNEASETKSATRSRRSLKYPGTDEEIPIAPMAKRQPLKSTPAMRHGMSAYIRKRNGEKVVPDLHRLIYRPWLYAGTPVGKKFERSS